jgi:hypothetical protein
MRASFGAFDRPNFEISPFGLLFDRRIYEPFGEPQYIDSPHRIEGDSAELGGWRTRTLELAVEVSDWIRPAHRIGSGSGYLSAVAPTIVCP